MINLKEIERRAVMFVDAEVELAEPKGYIKDDKGRLGKWITISGNAIFVVKSQKPREAFEQQLKGMKKKRTPQQDFDRAMKKAWKKTPKFGKFEEGESVSIIGSNKKYTVVQRHATKDDVLVVKYKDKKGKTHTESFKSGELIKDTK